MTARAFDVWLGARPVGSLGEAADGRIGFRFSDGYRQDPRRQVLGQRFEDDLDRVYAGAMADELPWFFENLLPEGRFRDLVERSARIEADDDLGLLACLGHDLPGAVTLRVQEAPAAPLDLPGAQAVTVPQVGTVELPHALRISLAGVQLKFSLLRDGKRFTLPAQGRDGDWIIKVGARDFSGLAENEHAMLAWARSAGFDVPDTELLQAAELPVLAKYVDEAERIFAIRRYDRQAGQRLHQEDFAQVVGMKPSGKYAFSYEQLGKVILGVLGRDGFDEFFRRLVLGVAIGNNDAHLKNWSILYRDGITPALAPLYDYQATIAWRTLGRTPALALGGKERAFSEIDDQCMQAFYRQLTGATAEQAMAQVEQTLARLHATREELATGALPQSHVRALEAHWQSVPLLRRFAPLALAR